MSATVMHQALAQGGQLTQGKDIDAPVSLDCDAVVVGSGASGGAVAYELAAMGFSVIVAEEGGYTSTEHFEVGGVNMVKRLYRDAGSSLIFGKPDILFSEGCAVGGSTVINGGICWRTPEKILKRWQWEHGLPESIFGAAALEPIFERVESMVSSTPQSPESLGQDAHLIKRGCDALGYKVVPVRRNQKDCMGTNNCIFGCPTGAKQSTLVSYLPEAVRRGTHIQADFRIKRILTDRSGRATGVRGTIRNPWTGQTFRSEIHSKVVVLCCGATQTPVLLKGSRLGNRWVGRNLLVHPNVKACGIYDEPVVGWRGTIQGFQVDEFRDEGILMATTFVPPGFLAATMPHIGPDLGELMANFNNLVVGGVLVEDSTSGRVWRAPGGQAVMTYRCTPKDMHMVKRGLALLSEIYFAGGARRVLLPIDGLPQIDSPDEIRKIYEHPMRPTELEMLTVHAMGSARMAVDEQHGVCDFTGQVFGHPGLYIADASIFPDAIGVNPQITIMTLATRVAWEIGEVLHQQQKAA